MRSGNVYVCSTLGTPRQRIHPMCATSWCLLHMLRLRFVTGCSWCRYKSSAAVSYCLQSETCAVQEVLMMFRKLGATSSVLSSQYVRHVFLPIAKGLAESSDKRPCIVGWCMLACASVHLPKVRLLASRHAWDMNGLICCHRSNRCLAPSHLVLFGKRHTDSC